MIWTPEIVERFKEMVAERLSSTEIAARLGISRSAASGKAHRLGVQLMGGRGAMDGKGKSRAKTTQHRKNSVIKQSARVHGVIAAVPAAAAGNVERLPWSGSAQMAGRPLDLLRANQCRFAVNDAQRGEEHLFCGAPSDGAWCNAHRKIVYQGKTASTLRSVKEAA
ncbi:MAG TPA: GcrA family cell cycle regulator [Hyphomonas sp.]|nr:GcrA family cell cycle regulator [Hyphomonas sp.]